MNFTTAKEIAKMFNINLNKKNVRNILIPHLEEQLAFENSIEKDSIFFEIFTFDTKKALQILNDYLK